MKLEFLEKKLITEQEQNNDFCITYLFTIRDDTRIEKLLYIHISGILFSGRDKNDVLKEVEIDVENYWSIIKNFDDTLGLYIGQNKSEIIYPKKQKKIVSGLIS